MIHPGLTTNMPDLIQYSIRPSCPEAHIYSIVLRVNRPDESGQVFTLPAWIPGSYMIRDFARHIVSIKASCEGESVALRKLDKQTWQADSVNGVLSLEYEVYAWDLSVRGSHLDTTHGFFNGTSVFLQVLGKEEKPVVVNIETPQGKSFKHWKVATSMPVESTDDLGVGAYRAANYRELIDYPVEMGDFQELAFKVQGIFHRMVFTGRCSFDQARLARDVQKICTHHAQFFGELPVDNYLFLTMVVGEGYGGLEHLDSTSLMCKRTDLPANNMQQISKGYRRYLSLCSHEYFHLWNVKRIRPDRLKHSGLSNEVHTELLWAFEGITSYYDDLALVRSGCIEVSSYLEVLAETITRVMRSAGRLKQSVAESSFDAWTRFYKQDENAPNAIVSYYSKGTLVAFGLDMLLRNETDERVSLDDLMVQLWLRYGKPDIGVPEHGVEELASELAGSDLSSFFAMAVHGCSELPLADWFDLLGIGYRLRAAGNQEDWGGYSEEPSDTKSKPALGARFKQSGDTVELTHVLDGGSAQAAGLSAGDRLVAINGIQVSAKGIESLFSEADPSVEMLIHAFRRDELMSFSVRPRMAALDTCELWLLPDDQCSERQLDRRRQWLFTD